MHTMTAMSRDLDQAFFIKFWRMNRKISILGTSIVIFLLLLGLAFFPGKNLSVSHAATSVTGSSLYTDTVIIMDNINQISIHDPHGYRYTAAQLYVNLAPSGDNVGLVKIPSSPTENPKILGLQSMDANGKALVNQKLGSFGPLDPNPTAYFTPALQTAGAILQQSSSPQNRKYIVLVTDAVALSGDQNPCPASAGQDFHNWFCTAGALEDQGINLILIGFTKPGLEDALLPTKTYLEAHGGTVLQVKDGDDVAQRLAQTYAELLTRTHPNIFLANFAGTPDTIQISAQDKLTDLTFVGVGVTGTSLSDIQTPTQENIAGKNNNGYTSTTGTGYWLENIANGNLVGTWHLHAGALAPSQVLVIGVSEGRFILLNPTPADPKSDIGVRYVAPQDSIVLRARVTKADDTPPVGIGFTVNPDSGNSAKFSRDNVPITAIPDNQEADLTAILQPTSTDYISIGLGEALANNTYFLKNFPITVKRDLANKDIQLTIPASHLLQRGEGVPITAQGVSSSVPQSLAIFAQAADTSNWTQVARNTSNDPTITGSFVPIQGCKTQYEIISIEEISGSFAADQVYDYLTLTQSAYQSDIVQNTVGQANLSSAPYLEWWSSEAAWDLKFSNTVCTPQTINLNVKFQDKAGSKQPSVGIMNGSSMLTLAPNTTSGESVVAKMGPCSPLWLQDYTVDLQLTAQSDVVSGNQFIQNGPGWRQTMTCPSVLTNSLRYWGPAFIILIILSILLARLVQMLFLPFVPPPHLVGEVTIHLDDPAIVAEKGGTLVATRVDPLILHIPSYRIPAHTGLWYLERHETNTDISYNLEVRESNQAMLAFSMAEDAGGKYVGVIATSHATGINLPTFRSSGKPVGQEIARFDDEPIVIGNDLIFPKVRIASV
jgi:hypothetical protein